MRKIKIVLSYDGSGFLGWASQPGKRTVEGEFKNGLKKVLPETQDFFVAGRTDAGVHAENQVVSFSSNISENFHESGVQKALNSAIPTDIFVKSVEFINGDFNARFSAVSRTYIYYLKHISKYSVFQRNYTSYFDKELDFGMLSSCLMLTPFHECYVLSCTQCSNCLFSYSEMISFRSIYNKSTIFCYPFIFSKG